MDNRRGFTMGLSYESRLKDHFIVGAELIYQQRGFEDKIYYPEPVFSYPFENPQTPKDLKFYYDYLAVPLKCGYIIGNKISAFANIGLVPSILLKATAKLPDELEIIDVTDLSPKFDLAGLFEIGGNVKISEKFFLTASFAYQHSFTTLSFANSNLLHHGLIFSGGIKYSFRN